MRVLRQLPAEPTVIRLMSELSGDLSVSTTPPGAEVFLRRFAEVRRVGVTPIQNELRVSEREGDPPLSSAIPLKSNLVTDQDNDTIDARYQ